MVEAVEAGTRFVKVAAAALPPAWSRAVAGVAAELATTPTTAVGQVFRTGGTARRECQGKATMAASLATTATAGAALSVVPAAAAQDLQASALHHHPAAGLVGLERRAPYFSALRTLRVVAAEAPS